MSTHAHDVAANVTDFVNEFPALMREFKDNMKHAFQLLNGAMTQSFTFSSEVLHASYEAGATVTVAGHAAEGKTLTDLSDTTPGKVGIAVLSPLVAFAFVSSVTVVPLILNSAKCFPNTVKRVFCLAHCDLLDEKGHKNIYQTDPLTKKHHKAYAIPGYVVAGLVATPGLLLVASFRILFNVIKAMVQTWLWVMRSTPIINFGSTIAIEDIGDHIRSDEHKRLTKIWLLGAASPGVVIGFIAGLLSASVALTFHGVKQFTIHNVRSLILGYRRVVNPFLPTATDINKEDGRLKRKKYLLGAPGLFLGGLLGVISNIAITLGRIASNSVKAFGQTWLWAVRKALPANHKNFINTTDDIGATLLGMGSLHRGHVENGLWRLIAGSPGLLTGFIAGGISAAIILACRGIACFVEHTLKSFIISYRNTVNPFLPAGTNVSLPDSRKKRYKLGLGASGVFLGTLVGSVSNIFITLGRIASNSVKAFGQTWLWLVRKALSDDHRNFIDRDDINDMLLNRKDLGSNWLWRSIAGSPGIALGVIAGGLSAAIILACRGIACFAEHALKSFIISYRNTVNPFLPAGTNVSLPDERDKRYKFGLGASGVFLGVLVGSVSNIFITLGRIASNSVKAFGQTWLWAVRKALPTRHEQAIPGKDLSDAFYAQKNESKIHKRNFLWRCIAGSPGIALGAIAGGLSAAIIFACRGAFAFMKHSITSFMALNKSYLNVATGRALFNGVGADDRTILEKGCGIAGYIFSTLTVGMLSSFIYVTRQSLPILGVALMTAASLLVITPLKIVIGLPLSACGVGNRFTSEEEQNSVDTTLLRIKHLYSNLSGTGKLPGERQADGYTGRIKADSTTGGVTLKQFIGKCLTLNLASPTERYLNVVLKTYREAKTNETEFSSALTTATAAFLKNEKNHSDSIFSEQGSSAERYNNIVRMTNTVTAYVVEGKYEMAAKPASQAFNTSRLFYYRKEESASSNSSSLTNSSKYSGEA